MSSDSRISRLKIPWSPAALCLGVIVLTHCDSPEEDRAILQTQDSKVGQSRQGNEVLGDESPLTPPKRFLRTDVRLKPTAEKDDMNVKVDIEEVLAGLRVGVIVRDADPGNYVVVFHESGECAGNHALGPVLDLMAPKTAKSSGVQRSDSERVLGDVEVKADGDGRGLWITSWGNLRKEDDKSVLERPLVLYRTSSGDKVSGDKLGDVVACAPVTMD